MRHCPINTLDTFCLKRLLYLQRNLINLWPKILNCGIGILKPYITVKKEFLTSIKNCFSYDIIL